MKKTLFATTSVSVLLLSLTASGAETDLNAIKADMTFFTDASCSQLKKNVRFGFRKLTKVGRSMDTVRFSISTVLRLSNWLAS